jgi:hypothetical protein
VEASFGFCNGLVHVLESGYTVTVEVVRSFLQMSFGAAQIGQRSSNLGVRFECWRSRSHDEGQRKNGKNSSELLLHGIFSLGVQGRGPGFNGNSVCKPACD